MLLNFSTHKNLKIANTFFKKNPKRIWTWRGPDNRIKNEIDYILTDNLKLINDVSTLNQINVGSDHKMLRCRVEINTKYEREKKLRKSPKPDHKKMRFNNETFRISN